MSWVALASIVLAFTTLDVLAVRSSDFQTCLQSGFCRRGRALAVRANSDNSWTSPYSIDASTLSISPSNATFKASVKNALYPEIKFDLEVRIHEDSVVRVRMDEVDGLHKRYNGAASWALIREPEISKTVRWMAGEEDVRVSYGDAIEVIVKYDPLKLTLLRGGREQIVLNGQGLLNMEHFRKKEGRLKVNPRAWFEGDFQDAFWEERFNNWTDTKPKGPESLSLDITFPNHPYVYGIPQHASPLSLPTTTGPNSHYTDPYRLWNSDVFEHLADSPMSLYGSIPVMHAHSGESTVGLFNAVASDTWVDVSHPNPNQSTLTHWISESGILDLFLLPGPNPSSIFAQYALLTGTLALPPLWSLGYHQCRWNYVSSDDIRAIQRDFDQEDIPVDVFWLDIEYAEERKYFMWHETRFPDPVEMVAEVAGVGRKIVAIIDPHIKRTPAYPIYAESLSKNLLIKDKDGNEYEGYCWSENSVWMDCFHPEAGEWWVQKFKTHELEGKEGEREFSWTKSTKDVFIWNDMNEPAVFNGPEISMPKDNIHYGGWEHRDVHNINGMLFHNLTSLAIKHRFNPPNPPQRPFVLTRSFYAGSQRFGAMWTGDNLGTWEHMAVGIKMVLANGVVGMGFGGSDVGGFFGNPTPEMLVRWYQVGIFSPFLRAHAHEDTKRREPFLLEEPYRRMIRDMLRLRYKLLAVWYTAFREASVSGKPILRPHYVEFPQDVNGFELDDQFFLGSSGLLVKPVTESEKGARKKKVEVYLPAEDEIYYNYFTHTIFFSTSSTSSNPSKSGGKLISLPCPLSQIPLFIRGGSIIPTRERPRRSSPLMFLDPFTLTIALSIKGEARGEVYLDDGVSYRHVVEREWVWREFVAVMISESEKKVKKEKKVLRIESRDLGKTRAHEAVDPNEIASLMTTITTTTTTTTTLTPYTPDNEFAKSIGEVRVEKIVVLGLEGKPVSVKVEGEEKELVWEFKKGRASGDKDLKEKEKEGAGVASKLVIKDPRVLITKDWAVVIVVEV